MVTDFLSVHFGVLSLEVIALVLGDDLEIVGFFVEESLFFSHFIEADFGFVFIFVNFDCIAVEFTHLVIANFDGIAIFLVIDQS